MKRCSTCKQEKSLDAFGRNHRCKECENERSRQRYLTKMEKLSEILDAAYAKGCVVCGNTTKEVIQFHHIEPHEGKRWNDSLSMKGVEEDLKKCVALCANCHLQVHAGTVILPIDAQRVLS